jgi:1-acyl-sn-glycerol-3-phosphate acyltransferase
MSTFFYAFSKNVVSAFLTTLWRMRVIGAEHVPLEGALIVAANHVSYFDPPALGCALPRPLHFMAKKELFDIPLLGSLIRAYNAYPIDRERGDIGAVKRSVETLKAGNAVLIFPEGRRNRSGSVSVRSGAALLASLSGARILPAYVHGTFHAGRFSQIKIVFGEPFRPGEGRKATREDLAKWSNEIMERIFALREQV